MPNNSGPWRSLGVARKSFAWLATICLGIHLEMSPKFHQRLHFTVIPLTQCHSIIITKANVWISLQRQYFMGWISDFREMFVLVVWISAQTKNYIEIVYNEGVS